MKGKTILMYLADGEPTGLLVAEIRNWTGKVLVAPRSQLDQLSKREEVRRTGVYLLVGPDPDDPSRQLVYVGESDNVLKRLLSHNRKDAKDFWERTVVIVSKDENLTMSHVRYLESRLIKMAQDARRANLTNDTAPELASLPEPDVADMEFFLDQVQMILPVLGFDFTQPRPGVGAREGAASESPVFELRKVGAVATAQEIDGQFVVFAGSTARKMGVPSWQSYKALREKLVADGSLVDSDDPACLVFAGGCARPRPPSSDSSSSTTPRSSSSCSPRRMACVILRRSSQIAGSHLRRSALVFVERRARGQRHLVAAARALARPAAAQLPTLPRERSADSGTSPAGAARGAPAGTRPASDTSP